MVSEPEQIPQLGLGVIEVDSNANDSDVDSFYSSDGESFTTSLESSIRQYRTENGRTYHSFREGKYAIPNDGLENDRLDLQHAMLSLMLDGKLYLAPIKEVHTCLDIGTGTGIWAIDFGDEHPEAEVTAIDLSPIQPSMVPPNVKFIIDDVEDTWTYPPNHFDYIHSRQMVGSIQDWDKLFAHCFRHTKPGGWVEFQDANTLDSDDGTLADTAALKRWWTLANDGFTKLGRPLIVAGAHKQRMRDAGFVDVQEVVYKLPTHGWAKHRKMKEIGIWSRENTLQGLEAIALAPLTRALGWSVEEVQVLVSKARADLNNLQIHSFYTMNFVWGRKPETSSE